MIVPSAPSAPPASDLEAGLDLHRIRRDTPGVAKTVHFNNAGAALSPAPVVEALVDHLRLEAEIGGYEAAARAQPAIDRFYAAAGRLINARPDEIAFIENATRAWDMAFYSVPFGAGDRILTAQAEYHSNYIAFLQMARRTGARIDVIPDDPDGQIDVDALAAMIDDRVRLIAITHMPTNGGLINPAAAVGRIARRHGIPFLLDACQTVGQMPIDVDALGCDLLSATGRKFLRGPRGTGFLYVRKSLLSRLEPPFLDGHAATWDAPDRYTLKPDATRFENWESYVAGRIGLATAIDYALDIGLPAIWDRVRRLADRLRDGLAAVDGVTVRDKGRDKGAIVSFSHDRHDADAIAQKLRARHINISVSDRNSTLLDMSQRALDTLARASVHYYNTEDEVDGALDVIRRLP